MSRDLPHLFPAGGDFLATGPAFAPRSTVATWICAVLFCVAIIGLSPFAPTSQDELLVEAGSNLVRQGILIACACAVLALIFNRPRLIGIYDLPLFLFGFFALAVASSLWAVDFSASIRRSLSLVIYSTTFILSFRMSAIDKTLKIFSVILILVLCVDLVSVFIIDQARHGAGELDQNLVGAWRGMHNHKNRAGVVSFLGIILFLYQVRSSGNKAWYAAIAIAFLFLIGTRSKTTILLVGVVVLYYLYVAVSQRTWGRAERYLAAGVAFMFGLCGIIGVWGELVSTLQDPHAVTGRVAIWTILYQYGLAHPLTGSGFGSFWQIGASSPALAYSKGWEAVSAPHGHNGYLDMFAALGIPGFVLAVSVVVIVPLIRSLNSSLAPEKKALMHSLIAFTAMHNLTELSIMSPGHEGWTAFLIAIGLLYYPRNAQGEQAPVRAGRNGRTQ